MYGEKERASAVTWMVTVIGLGQIIGQLLGGYLGPALGWRFPFIVSALPGLIVLPFFYFFVSEPRRGATEESLKALIDGGYVYSRTIKLSDYVQLVKVRTNLYLFVQGLVGTIPWGAIPLFLVKFLSESRGFSIQEATTVFLFFGIGTTLGTIFGGLAGGALFKRKASWLPLLCAITTFAGAFMAMLIFILPLGKDLLLTLAFGLVASFIASVTNPNVKTMLLDVNVPENRGSIFSIFNLTDSVGTGFGKFIGGILSVALGTGAALSISSAMWIPCAVLLLVISYIFSGDIRRMQQKLQAAASQMKGVPRPI
jgi:predicted MFS family arabinose efflux permease